MKGSDGEHREPKPHTPPQFPLYSNGEANHPNAVQRGQRKAKSSKMIEQPNEGKAANNRTQDTPPGQPYFLSCFRIVPYVVSYGHCPIAFAVL